MNRKRPQPEIKLDPCGSIEHEHHHWMIDGDSQGVCKHCGEERDFAALADQSPYSWRTSRQKIWKTQN